MSEIQLTEPQGVAGENSRELLARLDLEPTQIDRLFAAGVVN